MPSLSRHEFLQRTAMAGVAYLVSSVEGFSIAQQKKVRVGVIGLEGAKRLALQELSV